jgi:hypothetical protein
MEKEEGSDFPRWRKTVLSVTTEKAGACKSSLQWRRRNGGGRISVFV